MCKDPNFVLKLRPPILEVHQGETVASLYGEYTPRLKKRWNIMTKTVITYLGQD